ncbi:hypothetical protein ACP3V3_01905 [Vibrio sp. PNB22_3_1]
MTRTINTQDVEFWIHEGDLHPVNTEDGVGHFPISWVGITTPDGQFIHNHHCLAKFIDEPDYDEPVFVSSQYLCEALIETLKSKANIDLDDWSPIDL